MSKRPMNQTEQQALTQVITYLRDDCAELKDYRARRDSGEDVSLHIWRQVEPLVLYLREFKQRDCTDCGEHTHLTRCERCHKRCCEQCLRFIEWLTGRPYLCRACVQTALNNE